MSIPHQGSPPSVQRKRINENLVKNWKIGKLLKRISDQEIKQSLLENNPVPNNFLSRQKLGDCLPEILSETGKKNEIFWDRSLIKAQENLTNIIEPQSRLWAHLGHLRKDNEGVIDLNILLELVEIYVILVGQCTVGNNILEGKEY